MNKIILSGRLTKDIEIQTFGDNKVSKNSLAVNKKIKGREETFFIDVDFWNSQAEFLSNYSHKGAKIVVEGELRMNEYQDKLGNLVRKPFIYSNSVELMDSVYNKNEPKEENITKVSKVSVIVGGEDEGDEEELRQMKEKIRLKNAINQEKEYEIVDEDLPF